MFEAFERCCRRFVSLLATSLIVCCACGLKETKNELTVDAFMSCFIFDGVSIMCACFGMVCRARARGLLQVQGVG